ASLPADPWSHARATAEFDADSPDMLLAAIAGHDVRSGAAGRFAALSDLLPGAPETESRIEAFVAQHLLEGVAYHDPFTGVPTDPLRLMAILGQWRTLIEANRPISAAFGFAHWKRDTVDPLLWGGAHVPFHAARESLLDELPPDAAVAVWKARVA